MLILVKPATLSREQTLKAALRVLRAKGITIGGSWFLDADVEKSTSRTEGNGSSHRGGLLRHRAKAQVKTPSPNRHLRKRAVNLPTEVGATERFDGSERKLAGVNRVELSSQFLVPCLRASIHLRG